MKTTAGSETSRVSGNYHEQKEPVVMVMVSKSAMFLGTLVSESYVADWSRSSTIDRFNARKKFVFCDHRRLVLACL